MRLTSAVVLACATLLPVWIANSAGPLPEIELYGREFVDLSVWAKTRKLGFDWDKDSGNVELTSPWSRLEFDINSRRATLNGVAVWLSVPITRYGQDVYIASVDLRTLLNPLLRPARLGSDREVRCVAIDAGHGGKDPGNLAQGESEKRHALILAKLVKAGLEAAGLRVILTRSGDSFVPLTSRPEIARRRGADLFVSLHYNATENSKNDVKGVEVYCLTPSRVSSTNSREDDDATGALPGNAADDLNILLAYRIQSSLVRELDVEDRGVRRARFAVLRTLSMPGVLIEAGFMSAPDEAKEIFSTSRREATANAIVDGILAYKRVVER